MSKGNKEAAREAACFVTEKLATKEITTSIQRKVSRAAWMVVAISASVWTVLRNAASNCDGGSQMPAVEHAAVKASEERGVAGGGRVPIENCAVGEEQREHRADLVGGDLDAVVFSGLGYAGHQFGWQRVHRRVERLAAFAKGFEHGHAGGHGQRIAAQRAGLVDGAERRD